MIKYHQGLKQWLKKWKKHVFFCKKNKNTEIRIYKAARSHKIVLENPFLMGEYDNQGDFSYSIFEPPLVKFGNLDVSSQARLPSSVKGKSPYE